MKKLLMFQTMITPILIQILFWIGVISCVVLGVIDIVMHHDFWHGLQLIILGPLILRVIAEIPLILFRIYDRLSQISTKG